MLAFLLFVSVTISATFTFVTTDAKVYWPRKHPIAVNNGSINISHKEIQEGYRDSENYFTSCKLLNSTSYPGYFIFEVIIGDFTDYLIPRYQETYQDFVYEPCGILALINADSSLFDKLMPYTYIPYNPFDDQSPFADNGLSVKVPIKERQYLFLGGSIEDFPASILGTDSRKKLNEWGSKDLDYQKYKGGCCKRDKGSISTTDTWGLPYTINAYEINISYVYLNVNVSRENNTAEDMTQNFSILGKVSDIHMRSDIKYSGVSKCKWTINVANEKSITPLVFSFNSSCVLNKVISVNSLSPSLPVSVNVSCQIVQDKTLTKVFWPPSLDTGVAKRNREVSVLFPPSNHSAVNTTTKATDFVNVSTTPASAKNDGNNKKIILGVSIACALIVVLVIVGVTVFCICQRRKIQKQKTTDKGMSK